MGSSQRGCLLHYLRSLIKAPGEQGRTDAELLAAFSARHDETAFATIVQRHGAMVMTVCGRVLQRVEDREDAFQATFLALARDVASVRKRESVAGWLHGVARHVALDVRRAADRRRKHEARATPPPVKNPEWEAAWHEVQNLIDEEIRRLPSNYREPFILCCLENQSRAEAAARLGLTEGTVGSRLTEARRRLRVRLTRRGVELSAALAASALAGNSVSAHVPVLLTKAITRAALAFVSNETVAPNIVSAHVLALIHGVSPAMSWTKNATLLFLFIAFGLMGAGFGTIAYQRFDGGAVYAQPAVQQAIVEPGPAEKPHVTGRISGRVVRDEDGRPVAGANVQMIRDVGGTYPGGYRFQPILRARTNDQGEFHFDILKPEKYILWAFHGELASESRMEWGKAVAVDPNGTSPPVVLKLHPRDARTLRVKVLSQTNRKPIAGALVRLVGWTLIDSDHFTDANGQVKLLVDLQEGLPSPPETCYLQIGAKDFAAELRTVDLGAVQPAELEVKLKPGGSIEGRARDESGQPLSGVAIHVPGNEHDYCAYAETDAEGRYRLDYLPLNQAMQLHLRKMDYLDERKEFQVDAGHEQPARLDFVLKKRPHGGSVRGVVTDSQGKPIADAAVWNRGDDPNCMRSGITDAQGNFLLDNVFTHEGDHRLLVRAKGFASAMVEFKPGSAMQPVAVAVKLEMGHLIKGRVVNAAGKPIPRAEVYFDGSEGSWYTCDGTTTDADGRFNFDSLPGKTTFRFTKEGFESVDGMELPLDGANEVVVTMTTEVQSVIKGVIVDARTGKPLPRFTLRITLSPDARPDEPATGLSSGLAAAREYISLQGQFMVKGLNAGTPLQVDVSAEGYRRQVVRRVVAKAASEAEVVEIRMTTEDPPQLDK